MLTREEIIYALDEYWQKVKRDNPGEFMDIPGALDWYRVIPYDQLLQEYNNLIG